MPGRRVRVHPPLAPADGRALRYARTPLARVCSHLPTVSSPRRRADEETAQYLYARFAVPARRGVGVKEIKDALANVRARSPAKAFEDRVAEAVGALGLR